MSGHRVRAAIVGLGFVGAGDEEAGRRIGQDPRHLDGNHLEALSRHPRVELVAGCDLDDGLRGRFTERTMAKTYDDWRAMLAAASPEIVSIATAPALHAEITVACAESGVRAVYCEKPIALSAAEADRMLSACESAGTLLAINHNRRFHPHGRRLRDAVQSGLLGELTSVSLQWPSGRFGCAGTHFFDLVHMVTGRRTGAVTAVLDKSNRPDCRGPKFRDPGGWGLLRLDGGPVVTVDAPDYARTPGRTVFNGTEARATVAGGEIRVEFWDGRSDHWIAPKGRTSMDQAVEEIVRWLDDGGSFAFPYAAADAAHALEVITAMHLSDARDSAWIPLPLSGDDRAHEVHSG